MKQPRRSNWVELRTAEGRMVCRYDPERRLIEHVHRRVKTLFDLAEIEEKQDEFLANEGEV